MKSFEELAAKWDSERCANNCDPKNCAGLVRVVDPVASDFYGRPTLSFTLCAKKQTQSEKDRLANAGIESLSPALSLAFDKLTQSDPDLSGEDAVDLPRYSDGAVQPSLPGIFVVNPEKSFVAIYSSLVNAPRSMVKDQGAPTSTDSGEQLGTSTATSLVNISIDPNARAHTRARGKELASLTVRASNLTTALLKWYIAREVMSGCRDARYHLCPIIPENWNSRTFTERILALDRFDFVTGPQRYLEYLYEVIHNRTYSGQMTLIGCVGPPQIQLSTIGEFVNDILFNAIIVSGSWLECLV